MFLTEDFVSSVRIIMLNWICLSLFICLFVSFVCFSQVNTKYLSPLFMAYDDRLKEKESIIKAYDVGAFKSNSGCNKP